MPLQNSVAFIETPDMKEIVDRLQSLTGLSIDSESRADQSFALVYDGKEKSVITYQPLANTLEVYCDSLVHTYIFFSTLHVLQKMGGKVLDRKKFPSWKGRKWAEKRFWEVFMVL